MYHYLRNYPILSAFFMMHPDVQEDELVLIVKAISQGMKLGGKTIDSTNLVTMSRYELHELAKTFEIERHMMMRKDELQDCILKKYNEVFHVLPNTNYPCPSGISLPSLSIGTSQEANSTIDSHDITHYEEKYKVNNDGNDKNGFVRFLKHVFYHFFLRIYRNVRYWEKCWFIYRDDGTWYMIPDIDDVLFEYYKIAENSCISYDHLQAFGLYQKEIVHTTCIMKGVTDVIKTYSKTRLAAVPLQQQIEEPIIVNNVRKRKPLDDLRGRDKLDASMQLIFGRLFFHTKRFKMTCNALKSSNILMEEAIKRSKMEKTEILEIIDNCIDLAEIYLTKEEEEEEEEEDL
jgi:hypothetical protein